MTKKTASDIIHHKGKHYILASSSMADDRTQVLKYGNTFALFDRFGDVHPIRFGEQGIFHSGTRYLSHSELKINGLRPFLLSSNVLDDNTLLTADLTNPDITEDGKVKVARGDLHIFRSKFIWSGVCYESIKLSNFTKNSINFDLSFFFHSDFSDIFEVRGIKRKKRGTVREPIVKKHSVEICYKGLDKNTRTTIVETSETPADTTKDSFHYSVHLQPKAEKTILLTIRCGVDKRKISHIGFNHAYKLLLADRKKIRKSDCSIFSSNEQFNDLINRSYADVHMLTSTLPTGYYPYAGVPWFSTIFGRDGIITALEYLWINPEIAKGVLTTLARYQAKKLETRRDAEPGKILHESRKGEMAALGEIPFGRYYGSIDVTPLFVVLAGRYFERTGDRAIIKRLWPNIEGALHWIRQYGDSDKDGFIEYLKHSPNGLVNQGWKDSEDSISHTDGKLAKGSIALCEVQGYVYEATVMAATMAGALGHKSRQKSLTQSAAKFRAKFQKTFWNEKISMYVLGLDGRKKPLMVRTSNAGHCLYSGIASNDHAMKISQTMLKPDMFSGWGVRTLSSNEKNYNPMSYHNGSIWPHDNAVVAAGMARYGRKDMALKVLTGLFDASLFVDIHRLPELFCGFHRRPGEGPTLYPVACAPQAWSAGAPFLLLQSILGLKIDAANKRIIFDHPILPSFIDMIELRNLSIGSSHVDVQLIRHQNDVGVNVLKRTGTIEVIGLK